MKCRRCNAEFEGGRGFCPRCGVATNSYTTIRTSGEIQAKNKRKRGRGAILSLVSMGIVIAVVFVVVGIMQARQKENRIDAIRQTFEKGDEQLLYLQVGQFVKNYPDTPEAQEAQNLLHILAAGGEQTPELAESDEVSKRELSREEIAEKQLLSRLEGGLALVDDLAFEGPDWQGATRVVIHWRNLSGQDLQGIIFQLEALDADGQPLPCERRKDSRANLEAEGPFADNREGDAYRGAWLGVWFQPELAQVKLVGADVVFADGHHVRVDEKWIDKIYPPPAS